MKRYLRAVALSVALAALAGCAERQERDVTVSRGVTTVESTTTTTVPTINGVVRSVKVVRTSMGPWLPRLISPASAEVVGLQPIASVPVHVYLVNDDGTLSAQPIASVRANTDGHFTVQVPQVEVLSPEVVLVADVDGDMRLHRLVSGPSEQDITPLTDLVYDDIIERAKRDRIDLQYLDLDDLDDYYDSLDDQEIRVDLTGVDRYDLAVARLRSALAQHRASRDRLDEAFRAAVEARRAAPAGGRSMPPGQVGRDEWEGDHDRGFGNDPNRRAEKEARKDERDDDAEGIRRDDDLRDERNDRDRERGVGNGNRDGRNDDKDNGARKLPDGPGELDRDKDREPGDMGRNGEERGRSGEARDKSENSGQAKADKGNEGKGGNPGKGGKSD